MKRNLSNEEIKLAINYYNKKYDLNIHCYFSDEHDLLNHEIKKLREGFSFTAVVSIGSHVIAVRIDKQKTKNIFIIDDSFALLNTKDYKINTEDYKVSKDILFEAFYHCSRFELVTFIQSLENIDVIYSNQKRYQFDAGSCSTFALVNAKHLALHKKFFDETKVTKTSDNPLEREIFFFKPTKKHIKYDQSHKKIPLPLNADLYPHLFAIHNRTKKIRENIQNQDIKTNYNILSWLPRLW